MTNRFIPGPSLNRINFFDRPGGRTRTRKTGATASSAVSPSLGIR